MALSAVTANEFIEKIRHAANETRITDEFPDGVLLKWVHLDIIETILKLDGIINALYRKSSTIAIASSKLDISSLSMLNFEEPIWIILDNSSIPIDHAPVDLALAITADLSSEYDAKVVWYREANEIKFGIGSGGTVTGNFTVGYYVLPTEATTLATAIDLPLEYHELAMNATVIRILKKKEMLQAAQLKQNELDQKFDDIIQANLNMKPSDLRTGERSK